MSRKKWIGRTDAGIDFFPHFVKCRIQVGKQMTPDDVMRLYEGLPKYKRPRRVFFDNVPRNPTGKIEKPKLRRQYGGATGSFKIQTGES